MPLAAQLRQCALGASNFLLQSGTFGVSGNKIRAPPDFLEAHCRLAGRTGTQATQRAAQSVRHMLDAKVVAGNRGFTKLGYLPWIVLAKDIGELGEQLEIRANPSQQAVAIKRWLAGRCIDGD